MCMKVVATNIAYVEGTAAGFACGRLFKSMCYADNYAEITELCMWGKYRGQGVENAMKTVNIRKIQVVQINILLYNFNK